VLLTAGWRTDLGTALWITVSASLIVFTAISFRWSFSQKITPLLMPYLTLVGLLGSMVRGEPHAMSDQAPPLWLDLHIAIAVSVIGVLTVTAVTALSVALQERALKTKSIGPLSHLLPSVNEAEHLSGILLTIVQVMLGIGLMSGMAIEYYETGHFLVLDHKTLLSIAAFVLIGLLLIGHRICGVRGRIAARVVLTAYLLIMLASPGVKFVTQVLL
jgi:ABC-type uncharacterized transport system permease subunit